MTPDDLVSLIRKEASDDNIQNYLKYFKEEPGDDEAWNLFRAIYLSLSEKEKLIIMSFVRLVQIDSISSVLSILDNETYPDCQIKDIILLHGDDKINGDLGDIFWEQEEKLMGSN